MKDMTKASNPIYLAFFLLVVCGVSTLVMAVTAVKTSDPIRIAKEKETAEYLGKILPAFDKDKMEEKTVKAPGGASVKLYIATKDGQVVGYAAEAKGKGFGGDVNGLVSFEPDGTIRTVIVKTDHGETPGIGTKVTDRAVRRTFSDILHGVKPDTDKLQPNAALDSYSGIKPGDEKWTKEKDAAHFVSGATYSSNAVRDLVWDAATAVRDYIAAQGGAGSADVSATQENAGFADASATQPESNEQPPAGDASSTAPEQTENKEEK